MLAETREARRFLGIDIHRDYAVVVGVTLPNQIVLSARRVEYVRLRDWMRVNLRPSDEVAIEATMNTWTIFDQIKPFVTGVVVADARRVDLIAKAAVKTDARDALQLANLLAANLLPAVWVPPTPVRELRKLVAHRRALVKRCTMAINRVRSILNEHTLQQPSDLLTTDDWQAAVQPHVSNTDWLVIQDDLESIRQCKASIVKTEAELARLSTTDQWREQAAQVMQVEGFGIVHGMSALAAIGDIKRFEHADALASYSGLCPRKHQSGQKDDSGRISKEGRKGFRHTLIQAARQAIRNDAHWKDEHARLSKRMNSHKALVAIARKLAVILWYVLTKHEGCKSASDERLAQRFSTLRRWLSRHGIAVLPNSYFVRQRLQMLGRAPSMTRFTYGSTQRRVATADQLSEYLTAHPQVA
jgi:transposase